MWHVGILEHFGEGWVVVAQRQGGNLGEHIEHPVSVGIDNVIPIGLPRTTGTPLVSIQGERDDWQDQTLL